MGCTCQAHLFPVIVLIWHVSSGTCQVPPIWSHMPIGVCTEYLYQSLLWVGMVMICYCMVFLKVTGVAVVAEMRSFCHLSAFYSLQVMWLGFLCMCKVVSSHVLLASLFTLMINRAFLCHVLPVYQTICAT